MTGRVQVAAESVAAHVKTMQEIVHHRLEETEVVRLLTLVSNAELLLILEQFNQVYVAPQHIATISHRPR